MRRVTVERVVRDGEKALVYATEENGAKLCFHIDARGGERMQEILDQGDVVKAELPDPNDPDQPQISGVPDARHRTGVFRDLDQEEGFFTSHSHQWIWNGSYFTCSCGATKPR